MTQMIGPSFADELAAAGLVAPRCSWDAAGGYHIDDLDAADRAAFLAVLAAHDPAKPSKGDRQAALDALYTGKLAAGYADAATGHTFAIDAAAQAHLTAEGASAVATLTVPAPDTPAWPADYAYPDVAGASVALSAAGMLGLSQRCRAHVRALLLNYAALSAEIAAGSAPDVAAGWPA